MRFVRKQNLLVLRVCRWAGNASSRVLASSVFFVLGILGLQSCYALDMIHGFPFLRKKLRSNLARFTIAIRRAWSNSTGFYSNSVVRAHACSSRPRSSPHPCCWRWFFLIACRCCRSACLESEDALRKSPLLIVFCLLPLLPVSRQDETAPGCSQQSHPERAVPEPQGVFLSFLFFVVSFFPLSPARPPFFSSFLLHLCTPTCMHVSPTNTQTQTPFFSLLLALMTAGLLRVPLIYVPVHHGQPLTWVRLSGGRKGARERNRDTGEKRKREI